MEHLIDANLTCVISMDGYFSIDRLRLALNRVQRKHPVLRMLISEEDGELYYEADTAKAIPLRMVEVRSDDDCATECQVELTTAFPHHQPQLRVVWLKSELSNELLITTTHRICDGMSVFILVREILKSLYSDDALVPYEPITVHDIIGDLHDEGLRKRQRAARVMNAVVALIPGSKRPVKNNEICREWGVSKALSAALKTRCKHEHVSIHSALLTVLDRALQATFGKKAPSWIGSPFDGRRGRLSMIKRDMLFFSGGTFKIKAGVGSDTDFWERAREIQQEVRQKIDQELANISGKYQYFEMLKVPSKEKVRSIIRLQDFLNRHTKRREFSFSNLGNVALLDEDAPFQIKNFRLLLHSFGMRFLGIGVYSLHGQFRFMYLGDEKCLNHAEVDALQREFMALLEKHVGPYAVTSEPVDALSAVTG